MRARRQEEGGAGAQENGLVARRMLKDALEAGDAAAAARLRAAILAREAQIERGDAEKALDDWLAEEFRRDAFLSGEEDGKMANAEFETEDWREYEGNGLGGEF